MTKLNTTAKGDSFELEVFQFIKGYVNAGETHLNPKKCNFFPKKEYYSPKREKNICFDIAIESYISSPDKLAQLTIIECKNLKHNVPVDDVEEFANKLDQMTYKFGFKIKGMMFSRAGFASGTISIAKNYGIGLARLLPDEKVDWILDRTPKFSNVKDQHKERELEIIKALTETDFRGQSEALFLCHENCYTTSFIDFFNKIIGENLNRKNQKIKSLSTTNSVPYIGLEEIEKRIDKILEHFKDFGILDDTQIKLEIICDYFRKEHCFDFDFKKDLGVNSKGKEILGRLEFEKKKILITNKMELNSPRWRFTLAHEIGHLILHRNLYIPSLLNNHIDTNDILNWKQKNKEFTNLMKLEWQANTYASSLLLPRKLVINHVIAELKKLDITRFPSGLIYLDDQKCNIDTYEKILFSLHRHFNVSHQAINYRLSQLKILNNQRKKQNINDLISEFKITDRFSIDNTNNL